MARILSGGVYHLSHRIESDLRSRDCGLNSPKIKSLSDIAASILSIRSVNTSHLASVLPRDGNKESNYRYINRFLLSSGVNIDRVMSDFVFQLLENSTANGEIAVISLDQSKISDGFECLMLSLRVTDRAVPLLWRIVKTNGAIGFNVQKELLNSFYKIVPSHVSILIAADRFYGTSSLIELCKNHDWQYRIRLKTTLILTHEGGEITTGDAVKMKLSSLTNAKFNNSNVTTNIGIIHERGHKEAWIIAMDSTPNEYKILDYGMRWGIEAMFSDFKSRGFGITKTKLKHSDRIERLILAVTIALYWAVSTGMSDTTPLPKSKKNCKDHFYLSSLLALG